MVLDPGDSAKSRELMSIDPSPIRILIVDDQAILRQGIAALVTVMCSPSTAVTTVPMPSREG